MHASLNSEQRVVYEKYKFSAYVQSVTLTREQTNRWRNNKIIDPSPVSREETLRVEAATRGQSKNMLWNLLRLDRSTASRSSGGGSLQSNAIAFGNAQENAVKATNVELFEQLAQLASERVGCEVAQTILDCGMFISALGLHSASPDAYFAMADGSWVPVEIKCPFSYRDTTVDQMRLELGQSKRKYRVKHTALLVNKMGPPQFEVVKTHDHYRQMQRQMYVMRKAPICFYIVRFKQNLVVLTVLRDDDFCKKEMDKESNEFVAFAMNNASRSRFKRGDVRHASFTQNTADHAYDSVQVDMLVRRGLYMSYGQLRCAHCDGFALDGRVAFELAMSRVHEQCKGLALQEQKFDNAEFLDFNKRYSSLLINGHNNNNARTRAIEGYYVDGEGIIKTFCCGVRGNDTSRHHLPTCSYYLEVINKPRMVK